MAESGTKLGLDNFFEKRYEIEVKSILAFKTYTGSAHGCCVALLFLENGKYERELKREKSLPLLGIVKMKTNNRIPGEVGMCNHEVMRINISTTLNDRNI